MTLGTVALSLFDGLFGAIIGGAIAAWIALRTTKRVLAADAAAQDRDRALTAALRFREVITEYSKVADRVATWDEHAESLFLRLLRDQHLALKSAQFARRDDPDFTAWLAWLHDELTEGLATCRADLEHTAWLGDVAKILEGRLFNDGALERPERPAKP